MSQSTTHHHWLRILESMTLFTWNNGTQQFEHESVPCATEPLIFIVWCSRICTRCLALWLAVLRLTGGGVRSSSCFLFSSRWKLLYWQTNWCKCKQNKILANLVQIWKKKSKKKIWTFEMCHFLKILPITLNIWFNESCGRDLCGSRTKIRRIFLAKTRSNEPPSAA